MIYEHFGLETDPFSLRPDLEFLFLSRAHEEAIAHLVYGLEQQEDITLIVGDIGTGKTLALHRLLESVSDTFLPVSVTVTTLDFAQLLGLVLRKLDVEIGEGAGLDTMLYRFENHLVDIRATGRKVLLIVDEAQNLDVGCLESVRLLMNLAQPGPQVLQLVLAGQLGLLEKLDRPELKQFRQRIRVEYRLTCLDREETEAYVSHRLKTAGREKPLFRKAALDKIHAACAGVPRLVNHLAAASMLTAYVDRADAVDDRHIDIGELPGGRRSMETERPGTESAGTQTAVPASGRPDAKDEYATAHHVHGGESELRSSASATRHSVSHGRDSRSYWTVALVLLVILMSGAALKRGSWWPQKAQLWFQNDTTVATGPKAPSLPEPAAADSRKPPIALEPDATELETGADVPVEREKAPASSVSLTAGPPNRSLADSGNPEVGEVYETGLESGYAVHVASFTDIDRANVLRNSLEAQGVATFMREKDLATGQHWFRVYIGPFGNRPEADTTAQDLERDGTIGYWLVVKLPFGQG